MYRAALYRKLVIPIYGRISLKSFCNFSFNYSGNPKRKLRQCAESDSFTCSHLKISAGVREYTHSGVFFFPHCIRQPNRKADISVFFLTRLCRSWGADSTLRDKYIDERRNAETYRTYVHTHVRLRSKRRRKRRRRENIPPSLVKTGRRERGHGRFNLKCQENAGAEAREGRQEWIFLPDCPRVTEKCNHIPANGSPSTDSSFRERVHFIRKSRDSAAHQREESLFHLFDKSSRIRIDFRSNRTDLP